MDRQLSLGAYWILEPLGQGGMGVVYRARRKGSKRAVAIKTVSIAAPGRMDGIRREIEALTRIRHPGIVRIVDHGVHEGRPWYAMDLLEGESLRDFIHRVWSPFRPGSVPVKPTQTVSATVPATETSQAIEHPEAVEEGPPPLSVVSGRLPVAADALTQVLRIVRRICQTLAFMHGEGFVSCDLKPENILLVDGQPVLIDFGLTARFPASHGRESIETLRGMAGTIPYMSPEQVRGELIDARSDLYAVGCVLYELLTGQPPFVGTPLSVRQGHLHAKPTAPSKLVVGLPAVLDSLVLRLLGKSPESRLGFADEVGVALGRVVGGQSKESELPPSRPYLYRPRFIGRRKILEKITRLCRRTQMGKGAFVLVGGESGAGKTRLALEVMKSATGTQMSLVTSESTSISLRRDKPNTSAPLQVIRPLLRAIADRCQEGGEAAVERLLGLRQSVLAQYEPLLAVVPALAPLELPVSLPPEGARRRLFGYLAESISLYCQECPVLWILDDLGWADDLSLEFLNSLESEFFSEAPLLLLGLYRVEEPNVRIQLLEGQAHVTSHLLSKLQEHEVATMVTDMLALPTAGSEFAAYVTRAANGNPFFVTEHVRAAVSERLFYRDPEHTWRMRGTHDREAYERLPLPLSLLEVLERRLDSLSGHARASALAAAVLGRESETDLIVEVSELSSEVAVLALDELIRQHIVEEGREASTLRFVHDKLREVAYRAAPEKLHNVHERAAIILERKCGGEVTTAEHATELAHHYAAAGHSAKAAQYYRIAAKQAEAAFANVAAVELYNQGIAQARRLGAETTARRNLLPELCESLGDMLAMGGTRDRARESYSAALRHLAESNTVAYCRLHRKIGRTWEVEHKHGEALRLFRLAATTLADSGVADDRNAAEEWLQARLDELSVHYWLAQPQELEALVREVMPLAKKYGTPQQLAELYQSRIFHLLRRDRYAISGDALELSNKVLNISRAEGSSGRPWAFFQRGFLFLCSRRLEEAKGDLSIALQIARRTGDLVNQTRAAVYLAVAARMSDNEAEVVARLGEVGRLANDAGLREYIAVVAALRGWLYFRRGKFAESLNATGAALSEWTTYGGVFPFQWLALVPRIEAQLKTNDLDQAVESVRRLLGVDQQRLPSNVESLLSSAIAFWNQGRETDTCACLMSAIEVLHSHHFQ